MTERTKTVLVLERDPDVGEVIQMMVQMLGHQSILVNRPAAALAELKNRTVEVVLTNQLTGIYEQDLALAWLMRSISQEVKIVATIDWHGDPYFLGPVDAVVPKPFTLDQLRNAISTSNKR